MEENERTLLYFKIEEEASAKKYWWQKINPTVRQCRKKSNIQAGKLIYFHTPVPEYYCGKKTWDAEKLHVYLQDILNQVQPDDYFLHPQVRRLLGGEGNTDLPPMLLLEAMLGSKGRFSRLSICLPKEGGRGASDILIHLLTPYLSRINAVTVIGGEDWLYEELEEYLFEEYGIVAGRAKRPDKDSLTFNLWSGEGETVNFLDTMVKNGYNTKVN